MISQVKYGFQLTEFISNPVGKQFELTYKGHFLTHLQISGYLTKYIDILVMYVQ